MYDGWNHFPEHNYWKNNGLVITFSNLSAVIYHFWLLMSNHICFNTLFFLGMFGEARILVAKPKGNQPQIPLAKTQSMGQSPNNLSKCFTTVLPHFKLTHSTTTHVTLIYQDRETHQQSMWSW